MTDSGADVAHSPWPVTTRGTPTRRAGVGQGGEVLARLDVADVEHEPLGQPRSPARTRSTSSGRRRHHVGTRGLVHDHRVPPVSDPDPLGRERRHGHHGVGPPQGRPDQDPLARHPVPWERPGARRRRPCRGRWPPAARSVARGRSTSRPWIRSPGPKPRAPGDGPADPVRLGPAPGRSRPPGARPAPAGRTAATRSASTTETRAARSSRM